MWPFRKRPAKAEERSAGWPGSTGPHVAGGDPFWSWGTLAVGREISAHAAENLSAVIGAVSAISTTIASLPCYVVTADARADEVPDHPLQRLINFGTSDNETWADFIEGLLASTLLRGNSLAEIATDQRGRLIALNTLAWAQITPWMNDAGELAFDYLPTVPPNAGQRRRLLREDVLFVKDRSDDGILGVSRLSRCGGAMQLALDLQGFSNAFLQNAARPGGTLKTTVNIGDDQRRRLKEEWDMAFRGREYGKLAVLPAGAEYAALSQMSSDDQQIVAHRNLSVAEICRVFGTPPWLLADPSRSTFASASAAMKAFAMTTLLPWTRKLEASFSQTVLGTGYRLHFDIDSLLKADINDLYSALLKGRQGGWLTANDCRDQTGFAAVADGNDITPPVSGGQPASSEDPASPAPPADEDKIARLGERRAHGAAA